MFAILNFEVSSGGKMQWLHVNKALLPLFPPLYHLKVIKVFRFQRKTLLFSYGTFFVIMLIIIFFHKICPGDFSETIRPISKIFSGMIGIYLKFIPYWDFWKIHFRFRVRVHFLTFYDPFCARKFSKTIKDIELKFSG